MGMPYTGSAGWRYQMEEKKNYKPGRDRKPFRREEKKPFSRREQDDAPENMLY